MRMERPCIGHFMTRLSRLLAPQVMAHRPPLAARFWIYSAVAYLVPVIVQVAWPNSESIGDELVWLVTLVPAFLLALHYGLRGALAGLVLGTVLFVVVQAVLALNFTPDDWHITLPILIAYGTLAISVGWLSEELHTFYQRALRAERLAAIGEASMGIRHELSDVLSVIGAQTEVLIDRVGSEHDSQAALRLIRQSTDQAASLLESLTRLDVAPPTIHYSSGETALDLSQFTHPRDDQRA